MTFVESLDCPQSPPPFFFPDVSLRIFELRATLANLQDWCDRFLNIGDRHYFRALAPLTFLCLNNYPRMILTDFEDLGFATQNEYLFMFPVLRHDRWGNFWLPAEVTWAIPFIGVDNGNSALAGQLVLGFPKLVGTLALATDNAGVFTAEVAMPGLAALSKNSEQKLLPILAVETGAPVVDATGGPAAAPPFPWGLIATGFDLFDDAVLLMLEAVDPGLFSATNLKQIRDAETPTEACYQTLVRAEWRQSGTRDILRYDGASVTVFDNAVIKIAQELGLADPVTVAGAVAGAGGGTRFKAERAFGLTTDLRFGDVMNLAL